MAQNSTKTAKKRRGPGRPFLPGQSGNPGGRPKGFAEYVRSRVGEIGEKLVDGAMVLAFGSSDERRKFFGEPVRVSAKDRADALQYLTDRGFGKAPQVVELSGANGKPFRLDLRGLSDEELALLERLARNASPGA